MMPVTLAGLRILPPPRDRRDRESSSFLVNPTYARLLHRAGLRRQEDFLKLPDETVSGHPDRRVGRVQIGCGSAAVFAFLKREYRVPWKERLRNWWQGFGLASKSWREVRTLQLFRPEFSACPDWIAAGELPDGQAFLLIREVSNTLPLSRCLDHFRGDPAQRRRLARELGRTLADLHSLGIAHGDLYAQHVLVDPVTLKLSFVDWQRAIRKDSLSFRQRWRDLASIVATLPAESSTARDRLACLAAYLSHSGDIPLSIRQAQAGIDRETRHFRKRRHVRTKALPMLEPERPSLICLDGDGLRVTRSFLRLWPDGLPRCLQDKPRRNADIPLPDGDEGRLTVGCHRLSWYQRSGLFGQWMAPEQSEMNLLFRLQRHGIEAPRVLATGEHLLPDETIEAFLLTRELTSAIPLAEWLALPRELDQRERILKLAGVFLAQVHEAGCFFRDSLAALAVEDNSGASPRMVLTSAAGLTVRRWLPAWWRRCDLRQLVALTGFRNNNCIREGYRGARS